jgi:hypothetical protein
VQAQLEATRKESDMRLTALHKKFQKAVEDRGACTGLSQITSILPAACRNIPTLRRPLSLDK